MLKKFKIIPQRYQGSLVKIGSAYQAITWDNVEQALCCYMTSLGANKLMGYFSILPIRTHEDNIAIND